jgi:hypothetical protein
MGEHKPLDRRGLNVLVGYILDSADPNSAPGTFARISQEVLPGRTLREMNDALIEATSHAAGIYAQVEAITNPKEN